MTGAAKRKGDAAEREIVHILGDQLGLPVERAYGAGRPHDVGDLAGLPGVCAQVKAWADFSAGVGAALGSLDRQVLQSGADYGVAFNRRRGGLWVASMTIPMWCAMYREAVLR